MSTISFNSVWVKDIKFHSLYAGSSVKVFLRKLKKKKAESVYNLHLCVFGNVAHGIGNGRKMIPIESKFSGIIVVCRNLYACTVLLSLVQKVHCTYCVPLCSSLIGPIVTIVTPVIRLCNHIIVGIQNVQNLLGL